MRELTDLESNVDWVKEVLAGPPNNKIYERLDTRFDIQKIVEEVKQISNEYPPFLQSESFGGWSLLSSNGDYLDGWQMGHLCYKNENGKMVPDPEKFKAIGFKSSSEHIQPTQVMRPGLQKVIDTLKHMKLFPSRARLSLLRAHSHSSLHRDGADGSYAVRAHVPVITNEKCIFVCKEGWAHLPADGSTYLLYVNRLHQIFNNSAEDRFHIIADFSDKYGVTERHRIGE